MSQSAKRYRPAIKRACIERMRARESATWCVVEVGEDCDRQVAGPCSRRAAERAADRLYRSAVPAFAEPCPAYLVQEVA